MPACDSQRFEPPAPLALVTVKSDNGRFVIHDVPMLLDTGADVSLLPRAPLASLAMSDAEQCEIEGFNGTKTAAPVIKAELIFLGKTFRGEFLLVDNWHGILGRNVLNNLSLFLDGPNQKWSEHR